MVRRAMNRAPAPRDPWWPDHQRTCGGTYHKVREPEDYGKKKQKKADGAPGINKENDGLKGTPKIYDLLKREADGKSNTIPSSNSSMSSKSDSGSMSANNGTKISNLWRVENDDSSGKENDIQKINHAFTPFTGKGHVLGSSKGDTLTNSVGKKTVPKGKGFGTSLSLDDQDFQDVNFPLQNNKSSSSKSDHRNGNVTTSKSKRKAIDIDEDDFVSDVGISIRNNGEGEKSNFGVNIITKSATVRKDKDLNKETQVKVDSEVQLTIVDAFKNIGEKKVPLVVIDESATKSGHANSVQCPVCLIKVNESKINAHLDACLS